MSRTEKQKMLAGELYSVDAELAADQAATKLWLVRYNAALALPVSERHKILSERLAQVGKGAVIGRRSSATMATTSGSATARFSISTA